MPEGLISANIFKFILTLIALIFLSIFLFDLGTESGPGSDPDVQIIFPYRK